MDETVAESVRFDETSCPRSLEGREFVQCGFDGIDFTQRALSHARFTGCRFTGCNFSNVKFGGTSFQDCVLTGCKLLGADLSLCDRFLLGIGFEDCVLDMADLTRLPLKATRFKGSTLKDTDCSESDLSGSVFSDCDLLRTVFNRTDLRKSDFRTARNYLIDPTKNQVRKARFAWPGIMGLLWGFDIVLEGSNDKSEDE
jgi:uncharacterized protein YjbI with pentapeptide repeats